VVIVEDVEDLSRILRAERRIRRDRAEGQREDEGMGEPSTRRATIRRAIMSYHSLSPLSVARSASIAARRRNQETSGSRPSLAVRRTPRHGFGRSPLICSNWS
jgi:hypothetical protein